MAKEETKFKYTTEFQWDLLRYIIIDNNGLKALTKIRDEYFTLIEHQVLAKCIIDYHKKNSKIPGETLLRETVVNLLTSKDYIKLITKSEQDEILKLIPKLYIGMIRDADEIYGMIKKWSAYIRVKDLLEEIDPRNWEQYQQYGYKFQNAIEDEDEQNERQSSFLLQGVQERQHQRRERKTIHPTPYRQINQLTNAGGLEEGSIAVILDKEKKGKTAVLINIAKGYLRMGQKVLYLDFENGKEAIFTRFEQSLNHLGKKEIIEGENDKKVRQKFRKYLRIGGEVVVERLPAGTNTNQIQAIIDKYYREYGIVFQHIIYDFAGKMGSLSGKKDDTERISDVYVDISNLALKNKIIHSWSAHHVTREAAKARMKTRYESADIAKCIDIARHVHVIYGLNRTPEEEEAGFIRWEIVEQRDGPKGRGVFTLDSETQVMKELSKSERKEYDDNFAFSIEDEVPSDSEKKERKAKKDL